MRLLLLTADLMCSSQVVGLARGLGLALVTCGSADKLTAAAAEGPSIVVLDLNAAGIDLAQLVPQLRSAAHVPRGIVAFGPHVHESRLAAAREAHCDEVLARGQFYAQGEQILRRYLAGLQGP